MLHICLVLGGFLIMIILIALIMQGDYVFQTQFTTAVLDTLRNRVMTDRELRTAMQDYGFTVSAPWFYYQMHMLAASGQVVKWIEVKDESQGCASKVTLYTLP